MKTFPDIKYFNYILFWKETSSNIKCRSQSWKTEASRKNVHNETNNNTTKFAIYTGPFIWVVQKALSVQLSSVQSLSRVRFFATPWITARQASLSITNSQSPLRLASIESVMPSSHLIPCRPLLFLPPIPPRIRVFCNESTLCMRWPKYWSFSFSIIPSEEIPGLISFRMDWLDLLAVVLKVNLLWLSVPVLNMTLKILMK